MANNVNTHEAELSIEAVSSVFAHDIATPLTTARLNADLLLEHLALLEQAVDSEQAKALPVHIRTALKNSPRTIHSSLRSIQRSLQDYKNYLNACRTEENLTRVSPSASSPSSNASPTTHIKALRILLVDDEQIHHDIAAAVIGKIHDLAHEFSGTAALERCHSEHFDVILMDMQMPSLSGPHTVAKFRSLFPEATPHDGEQHLQPKKETDENKITRIFGLTSMPIEKSKPELRELGFDGFLEKPLKYDKFKQLIDSFI